VLDEFGEVLEGSEPPGLLLGLRLLPLLSTHLSFPEIGAEPGPVNWGFLRGRRVFIPSGGCNSTRPRGVIVS